MSGALPLEKNEQLGVTADMRASWEDLAARSGASPFLYPGWIESWCRAFRPDRLDVRTVWHGGRLAALVPLLDERGVRRSPTNWHTPEFGILADGPAVREQLVTELLAGRERRLDLGHLSEEDAALVRSRAGAMAIRLVEWVQQQSPWIDPSGSWEDYVGRRDGRWIRQLGKRRGRLAGRGRLSFEVHDGREGLASMLEEGFQLEGAGWKGETGSAILSRASTRRFYAEVAEWGAARGWLRLGFLRLDGRAIAFDFCLEHDGVHYFLKTGFEPSLGSLAPGLVLRHDMIRRSFDLQLRSHELLGGAERWKLAWTERTRPRYRVMAFGTSASAAVDWLLQSRGRPLVKRLVRRSERVQSLRRQLRRGSRG